MIMTMRSKQRPLFLCLGLFAMTLIVAIFSLSLNIKTSPINKDITKLGKELRLLHEQNEEYLRLYLDATRLSSVEEIAKNSLQMSIPEKVNFIITTQEKPH
jgi:cell division protein FtsL